MEQEQQMREVYGNEGGTAKTDQGTGGETPKNLIIVVVVAVIIVVLALMYLWGSTVPTEMPEPDAETPTELSVTDDQTETLKVVSPSDEIEQIENDLSATELDSIDAELGAFEAELDTALVSE